MITIILIMMRMEIDDMTSISPIADMPMMVGTDQSTSYSFDGLSFTQLYADYLFIWGNILLYR